MKPRHLITFILIATLLTSCHKDAQIDPQTPVITEQTVEPLATEANFTWTVDFTGKISSVVKIGLKADLSDAVNYGDDTPTFQKDFTATATGLTKTTTYYYSYELWNPGMSYQSDVYSFTTLDEGLATVTTTTVTEISSSSAKCGGNVTYDGNHTVTERGICWSTSHNPDINGSHISSGTGTGSFTCSINNLEPETQYYVRAYATNSFGTNYGNELSFTTAAYPTGAINGLFSISSSEQVYFSQGNLQYIGSTETWKFADHQWDVIGDSQGNSSQSTIRDLFGWGTSGWNCGNTYYRPYDTDNSNSSLYGPSGSNNLTGSYANADWGIYNKIANGGNQAGLWRTLTREEWEYLFDTRQGSWLNGVASARYAKAKVNDMAGVILFPDSYTHPGGVSEPSNINQPDASSASNSYSGDDWNKMEQAGCVFLPAAGLRGGTSVFNVGFGGYWSASYYDSFHAYSVSDHLNPSGSSWRYNGQSVRLVRSAQ